MRRLAPELARRIDRLSWRAHLFHRFAHHPLCREYAPEVVRIGRRCRVCKGCTLVGLGLTAGAIVGLIVQVPAGGAGLLAGAAALVAAASLRVAIGKVASRLLPASIGGFLTSGAISAPSPAALGIAGGVWAAAVLLFLGYRRRGPDRRACLACQEGDAAGSCRGVAPIVRRERAFRRVSGRWIDAADRDQSLGVQ
jgi:hypothetical protein